MRYGIKEKIYIDQHGPVEGGPFMLNFDEIEKFLNEFKKEFIIIKIQAEEKLSAQEKNEFISMIHDRVGKYLITS